ncbi:hypothetical protein TcasGA2_TC015593 [Tribolium castaneum]|uniref:Uncharacterized protein n=1 Tax=Tribolium castaneum TaxID=7070 RepID=D2A5U1_TRICA|nr:PREDICTED: uncharacterized protein LOC103313389 [Tribolium castaneum]EFA05417.1 hypothetical protein TcasGA2_TC015593 [Tribolium castaneum]|eukprot:XP_008194715.1 PREDICTED: uncharacterized protein LOC103313389 [Tribolium castaneum]
MLLLRSGSLLVLIVPIFAKPFLYNAPQALTSFVSSASAASSGPQGNIADLRRQPAKLQDELDNDDFFKDEEDSLQQPEVEEEMPNDAPPGIFRQKINKLIQKYRFFTSLTNSATPSNDDDFQREFDDFDKEFEEDVGKNNNLTENLGYFYNKPSVKSGKQEASASRFSPSNIGVFFMELIGSLVGLVYGAAAQLNYPGTTVAPA